MYDVSEAASVRVFELDWSCSLTMEFFFIQTIYNTQRIFSHKGTKTNWEYKTVNTTVICNKHSYNEICHFFTPLHVSVYFWPSSGGYSLCKNFLAKLLLWIHVVSFNGTVFSYECFVLSSYVLFKLFKVKIQNQLKLAYLYVIKLINKIGCLLLLC
jgi:hypothetical protein